MSFVVGKNEVELKRNSRNVNVPDDHRAKLMYYLGCVCSLLDMTGNETQRRFQDYQNYWKIQSLQEKKTLLYLCALLNPDVLDDECIFNLESIDSGNEFFEIKQMSHVLGISESIMIGGKRTRVTKIMVYKKSWIRNNFELPLVRLNEECERIERRTSEACTIL